MPSRAANPGRKERAMNTHGRCEILRAMELLARTVEDDHVFTEWLMEGVADGDITPDTTDNEMDGYIADDEVFAGMLYTFMHLMCSAFENGGLSVDGVKSKFYDNFK